MLSKAVMKYIRISPRKFRQVIPLVMGKNAEEAIFILMSVKKYASKYAIELLKAAIANAKRKAQGLDVSTLYVSKMTADGGPMLKRFRAASMGRASMIKKRTSHLTVELDVRQPKATEEPKSKEKGTGKKMPSRAKAAAAKAAHHAQAPKKTKGKEQVKSESGKKGKD